MGVEHSLEPARDCNATLVSNERVVMVLPSVAKAVLGASAGLQLRKSTGVPSNRRTPFGTTGLPARRSIVDFGRRYEEKSSILTQI